ncbi:MAG: hypothetical protein M3N47_00210, partial [Chloroflexota bacterium]|nr:hypothetical protein [Chloroflexota bacterium]
MATTVPGAERDRQLALVPDPDRIGLLFVHGMGEHERGDTLKQFGEPLYTWIDRWLAGDKLHRRGHLRRLSDSSLYLPHAHDLTAPAHALVELDGPWGEHGRRRTVQALAAEAWWAKEIKSPSFSQVASWGLGLAPWMIVRYFRGGVKGWQGLGGRPERPKVDLIPLQQLLALPIVVLFQLLLLSLTVIGVVPMLRPFIASVQQKLTASLGDPQIMVSSPLQFNAMTERVLQELRWLRAQGCAKIAVIAHSQGTGVAHAALRRDSKRVGLFVTFGTAIEKLHVARQIQRSERRLATGTLLTTLGVCSLLIGAITLFKTWPLGGYELDNGYVITGQASDPYLLGRWLLAGGVFLILARQALWLEWVQQGRHRAGRWLTIAGGVLVVVGLELVLRAGGAVKLAWPEWNRDAVRDWLTTWPPTSGALWLSAGCFVAGLGLAALREWQSPHQDDQGAMMPSRIRALPGRRSWRNVWEWLRGTWVGNVLAVVVLLAGWFPLALVNLSRSDSDDAILFLILTGLALCLAAVSVPIVDASEIDATLLAIPRAAGDGTLVWRDYWAAADPVPDDTLTEPGGDVDFCSKRVQNRDSIIGDHTNYEENVEQFVGPVVLHLARIAKVFPGGVPVRADEVPPTWQVVARAAERRPKRVTALSRGWLICLLGVPLTWLILGTAGLTYLGIPVRDLLDATMAILPEVGSESLGSWLPLPLLGAVLVAVIGIAWYRVVVAPAWH